MIVRRQRLPALVDSDDSAQTSYIAAHAHTQTLYTWWYYSSWNPCWNQTLYQKSACHQNQGISGATDWLTHSKPKFLFPNTKLSQGKSAYSVSPGKRLLNGDTYIHTYTLHTYIDTDTHTLNGHFSATTEVSWYQKGKTNLDFSETRQITTPAPHHSFFTGRMPFLPPNQQRQSTDGTGGNDAALLLTMNKQS